MQVSSFFHREHSCQQHPKPKKKGGGWGTKVEKRREGREKKKTLSVLRGNVQQTERNRPGLKESIGSSAGSGKN